jgi:hypothetical protein
VRELSFTFFKHKKANVGTLKIKTWEMWIKDLNHHEVRGSPKDTNNIKSLNTKKNGPAVVLGELKPGKTRSKENMHLAHAIGLDLDSLPDEKIEEINERILPFEYFLYTTHKHESKAVGELARLRIILPLKEPIVAIEYPKYWDAFNEICFNCNDPQTRDISRLHFLPSTFDISKAYTIHNKGKWISKEDLDPYINTSPKPKKQSEYAQKLTLESIKNKLAVIKSYDSLKHISTSILKGNSWADPGHRHGPILDITMWLANKNPNLSDELIEELFRPSWEAMDPPPDMKEIKDAYHGAVKKAEAYKKEKSKPQKKENVYTESELEHIAKKQKCSISDLSNRWVIQSGGGGWVLKKTGNYSKLIDYRDINIGIRKILKHAPVDLIKTNVSTGNTQPKNLGEIVYEYGDLSERNIADMQAQYSYFDSETKTMIEAVCPLRPSLKPKYDPQIDQWLQYLTGPNYEKTIDWMSACPQLDKLLCVIYFHASKGSGKSMFAYGMARLWTTSQPSDLGLILSDFNEALVDCPLIFADEQLPRKYKWESITPQLRAMMSVMSRTLKRKHKTPSELQGAVRLIMAANNEFLMDSNEVATGDDLDAMAERFLYIKVLGDKAANYLKELGKEIVGPWWTRGIAEHALWLMENHVIKNPGARFTVEGDLSQMHRLLMTGSLWNSLTCEWLIRYLENPSQFDTNDTKLVRIEDGQLLANTQGVIDGWNEYFKTTKYEPTVSKIGAALRALAGTSKQKQKRHRSKRIWYYVIDINHLIAWAERYRISDKETILGRLQEKPDTKNVLEMDLKRKNQRNIFDDMETKSKKEEY